MLVGPLDHFTLQCRPEDLADLRGFYVQAFGLADGPRPAFPFPGHWLYSGDRPLVHLAGKLGVRPPAGTGVLDHVSFQGQDLAGLRDRLNSLGVPFTEVPVPGFPLHQVFLRDPLGLRLEVTFRLPAASSQRAC